MRKRAAKNGNEAGDFPERKTVGVPMTRADLEALTAYRDAKGKADMVRPAEGPAALAVFRRGLRALKEEKV